MYWKYSEAHGGVNPAVSYIQAAKETGFGNFGGVITAEYHNPCGLKTKQGGEDNDPNAHQRFQNWDDGVKAHLDHLALYAGAKGYPRSVTTDPRHFSSICGKAKTVKALSGNWAPSHDYAKSILNIYNELNAKASVLKPYMYIDSPSMNSTVTGDKVTIRGWAINKSVVKAVHVYVNGVKKTTVGVWQERNDVAKVFPEYPSVKTSGFTAELDKSQFNNGLNTITLYAV